MYTFKDNFPSKSTQKAIEQIQDPDELTNSEAVFHAWEQIEQGFIDLWYLEKAAHERCKTVSDKSLHAAYANYYLESYMKFCENANGMQSCDFEIPLKEEVY
jgi:hypothetical protein